MLLSISYSVAIQPQLTSAELSSSPFISLARALVVVAIAIAPFFQQSITFQNAGIPSSGNGQASLAAFASSAFTYKGSVGYVASSYAGYGKEYHQ